MSSLNILIGGESFKELREHNYCYIDKTALLEEMLDRVPPKVSLITRPRRFGKTLALSMLNEFFDIRKDSQQLFDGLKVSKNQKICAAWMNQYPTIFLTLKGIEGQIFAHALEKFAIAISQICSEHAYLFNAACFDAEMRDSLQLLKNGQATAARLEDALLLLCRAMEAYWNKPAILLIDEYDVPVNHAEQKDYYDEMIGFMRNTLGAALKTNSSLKFAVLTGCIRIARESIFTGLNNFKCYGVSEALYADKFGFTSAEVDALLSEGGLAERKTVIKEWYDGYRFGKGTEIYCPWDILQYVYDLQIDPDMKPQAYWKNTSSNAIVRTLINKSGPQTRSRVEKLIEGSSIEEYLTEDLTYDIVYSHESSIWSMLYLTGYLTKASVQPDSGKTALVIPNKEVRTIFTTTVAEWFRQSLAKRDLCPLAEALWNGDAATVQEMLKQILYGTISYYDSAENFYHGFLAGLLSGMGLDVESSQENGLGRTDIAIVDGLNSRAIIIELKYAARYEDLETKAEEGLKQIDERKYACGLPPQIRRVLKYGIAFWKKENAVRAGQSSR
ncbi:AAA family ATPase [bacterium]|nr:AAA family ATPase [bacterium]